MSDGKRGAIHVVEAGAIADVGRERCGLTDTGNAERFVDQFGNDARFCHAWNSWLVWDERRWRVDDDEVALRRTKEVARSLYVEAADTNDTDRRAALAAWAKRSEEANRRRAMLGLARSETGIAISVDRLDRDGLVFNCCNGTLDLATFELRPHRREDYITKMCPTPYVPGARCAKWVAFLERVLPDDDERAYFQRFVGYGMTGDVGEQVLLFAHGEGSNGKTTAFQAIQEVLTTNFAIQIATDLLVAKRQRNHPTELADLFGVRLAIGTETAKQQELDEPLIKQLTGGDHIRTRRMHEDFWEFKPSHKLVLLTNHIPRIHGNDYATWRRLHALEFPVRISGAEKDKKLLGKLLAEREGILAWAVEGCRQWQMLGLCPPAGVQLERPQAAPTAAQKFIQLFVVRRAGSRAQATELFNAFGAWCKTSGEAIVGQHEFGRAMGAAGFGKKKTGGHTVYVDTQVRPDRDSAQGPSGTIGTNLCIDSPTSSRERTNAQQGPHGPCAPSDGSYDPEKGDSEESHVSVSALHVGVVEPCSSRADEGWEES